MARLSNNVREQMAWALVRHRFNERAEALCRESVELFGLVYSDQYDATTLKLIKQIEKSHRRAFQTADSLTVNVAGHRVTVGRRAIGSTRNGWGASWKAEAEGRPFLQGELVYSNVAYLDGPIADRLNAFAEAEQAFSSELDPAYRRALGALTAFGTGKRLAQNWPEAMPVIGCLIPESDRQLPVVQVAALNVEFELPPELAEAA